MQSGVRVSFIPKTKKELSVEYGCSPATITKWCREIGIDTRQMLSIPQVKKFYKHYDYPQKEVEVNVFR